MAIITIDLILTGSSLDFSEITEYLGVNPTKTRKKNDWPTISIQMGIAQDEWIYCGQSKDGWTTSEALSEFAQLFQGKETAVQKLLKKYNMRVCVLINVQCNTDELPVINVSPTNNVFLSSFEAELMFNLQLNDV